MRTSRDGRGPSSRNGWTLIELLVAAAIWTVAITQIDGVWSSIDKQMLMLVHRAAVNQEARTARACLFSDLAEASNMRRDALGNVELYGVGPEAHQITYRKIGDDLVREDQDDSWSVPIATYLDSASYTFYDENGDGDEEGVVAAWTFRKLDSSNQTVAEVTFNLYYREGIPEEED